MTRRSQSVGAMIAMHHMKGYMIAMRSKRERDNKTRIGLAISRLLDAAGAAWRADAEINFSESPSVGREHNARIKWDAFDEEERCLRTIAEQCAAPRQMAALHDLEIELREQAQGSQDGYLLDVANRLRTALVKIEAEHGVTYRTEETP